MTRSRSSHATEVKVFRTENKLSMKAIDAALFSVLEQILFFVIDEVKQGVDLFGFKRVGVVY